MPGLYALNVRTLQHPAHAAGWPRRSSLRWSMHRVVVTKRRGRCSPAGREVGDPCEAGTLCGPLSRASKESVMQREARCRWSTLFLHHGTVCKAGLVHGESSGRTVHMCEAHYAASLADMRTALPVKWKHHLVHVHLYANSANDCAASRVGVAAVRGSQKHGARSSPRRPRDRDRQRSRM